MKEVWIAVRDLSLKQFGKMSLLIISLLLSMIAAILEGASFGFILLAFGFIGDQEKIANVPFFSQSFLLYFTSVFSKDMLFILSITAAVVVQILKSGFNLISQVLSVMINSEIQVHLQNKIYAQILNFTFSCASRYKVGELIEYAKTPSTTVHTVLDNFNKSIVAIFNILALVVMMFILSPVLTSLVILIFGFLGILQKYIVKLLTQHSYRFSEYLNDFSRNIVQTLHGLRAIFIFDRQKEVLNKTSLLLDKIARINKHMTLLTNAIPFVNEISGISIVGVFLVLGNMFGGANGSLPILLTFVTIAYRLNGKIQQFITSIGAIAHLWGHVDRINEILSPKNKEFAPSGGKEIKDFRYSIKLQNISLFYSERSVPAINHLNCDIKKGNVTAFVGLSGAGKSSVLDLLLRLYEPTEGVISIDGKPISQFNIGSWRHLFGVVSQDIFIFNDTIEDNIRFGKQHLSEEQIIKYAKLAGADEFISKLPQNYQTVVGERGYRLSGGERQRLSLARALVRNPQILILDEATSNLDSKSEFLIKKALFELQKEKTLIIVAHRLSTIMHADKIIVMEQGSIKESGTHQQLINDKGLYASLWEIQSTDKEQLNHPVSVI